MWFLFLLIPTIILFVLLISPVGVNIKYTYDSRESNDTETGEVNLAEPVTGVHLSLLWGLINLRLLLSSMDLGYRALNPVLKIRARLAARNDSTLTRKKTRITPARALKLAKTATDIIQKTRPAYTYLMSKTTLQRFSWRTGLAFSEEDKTGIASGALWTIKGTFVAFIYTLMKGPAPAPEIIIKPFFNVPPMFWSQINIRVSLRTAHFMLAGLKAVWYLIKGRAINN